MKFGIVQERKSKKEKTESNRESQRRDVWTNDTAR